MVSTRLGLGVWIPAMGNRLGLYLRLKVDLSLVACANRKLVYLDRCDTSDLARHMQWGSVVPRTPSVRRDIGDFLAAPHEPAGWTEVPTLLRSVRNAVCRPNGARLGPLAR